MTSPDADLALLRAVAARVMGWEWRQWRHQPTQRFLLDIDGMPTGYPSGDPADMNRPPLDDSGEGYYPDWLGRDWEQVVERMRGLGYALYLTWWPDQGCHAYIHRVGNPQEPVGAADAPTIGEAVCRAALAVMRESEPPDADNGPILAE